MAVTYQPVVGDWYLSAAGESFEVVAYDADEEAIEIQYFDGTVEELDLDTWLEIGAEPAQPPEDWSGSLDVAREDYGNDDTGVSYMSGSPLDDPNL